MALIHGNPHRPCEHGCDGSPVCDSCKADRAGFARAVACALWQLLDEINTLDDLHHLDDPSFRRTVSTMLAAQRRILSADDFAAWCKTTSGEHWTLGDKTRADAKAPPDQPCNQCGGKCCLAPPAVGSALGVVGSFQNTTMHYGVKNHVCGACRDGRQLEPA